MERVTSNLHRGRAIIQIDFGGCTPGTFAPVISDALRLFTSAPRGSVLALTCLENVRFDPGTVVEMQKFATEAMPFLKANALVGIVGLKKVVFSGIKPLYKVPVELFDTREASLDWLASR